MKLNDEATAPEAMTRLRNSRRELRSGPEVGGMRRELSHYFGGRAQGSGGVADADIGGLLRRHAAPVADQVQPLPPGARGLLVAVPRVLLPRLWSGWPRHVAATHIPLTEPLDERFPRRRRDTTADESRDHAVLVGERITSVGGHPSLRIGALLGTHKHSISDIFSEAHSH